MPHISRSVSAIGLAVIVFTLTGCGEKQQEAPIDISDGGATSAVSQTAGASSDEGDSAAGTCPTVPQDGYELFSSDQVVAAPADGAVYGDGTPISWTFAGPVEGAPDVDIVYVNNAGDAINTGGIFLDDMGDNTWGADRNVFDSGADGRPGFMILGLTHDAAADGEGTISGTHEIVGVYCVTLKVAP